MKLSHINIFSLGKEYFEVLVLNDAFELTSFSEHFADFLIDTKNFYFLQSPNWSPNLRIAIDRIGQRKVGQQHG